MPRKYRPHYPGEKLTPGTLCKIGGVTYRLDRKNRIVYVSDLNKMFLILDFPSYGPEVKELYAYGWTWKQAKNENEQLKLRFPA